MSGSALVAKAVVKAAEKLATKHAAPFLLAPFSRENRKFAEARQIEFEKNVVANLQAEFQELLSNGIELKSRLKALEEDPQFLFVRRNVGFEAAREALDERRLMLSHVAAGLYEESLSIEQKARVERKLRDLDTHDVRVLYGLSRVAAQRAEAVRHKLWRDSGASADLLLGAGCLREVIKEGAFGGAAPRELWLSEVGHEILRAARSYVALRGAPFDVPGRERRAEDRSDEDARACVARHPTLSSLLGKLRSMRRNWKVFVRRESAGQVSPNSPPYPHLAFQADLQMRMMLDQITGELAGGELSLTTRDHEGPPPSVLGFLAGSEDLLRYIAEFVEAHWNVI